MNNLLASSISALISVIGEDRTASGFVLEILILLVKIQHAIELLMRLLLSPSIAHMSRIYGSEKRGQAKCESASAHSKARRKNKFATTSFRPQAPGDTVDGDQGLGLGAMARKDCMKPRRPPSSERRANNSSKIREETSFSSLDFILSSSAPSTRVGTRGSKVGCIVDARDSFLSITVVVIQSGRSYL